MEEILREWQGFIRRLPGECAGVRPFILESWQRSHAAGVAPEPAAPQLQRVPEAELRRRQQAAAELIRLAAPHLDWITAALGSVSHVAYITDADGIVLHSVGDPRHMADFGLSPGYDWSEQTMGTNGAGTALASRQPAAVIGPEHYARPFHGFVCTGAPIFGPDGSLLGALDLSTSLADGKPERLALVAHVAFTIEHTLASHRLEQEHRRTHGFLATLAHELRNPLAPLRSALGMLQHRRKGADADLPPAERDRVHRVMDQQVGQLERLIADLNDVSRVAQGKVNLVWEEVDLCGAAQDAALGLQPLLEQAGIALDLQVPDGALLIRADRGRLMQVLSNLLNNACKFTPSGGRVGLQVRAGGDRAYLHVRDTGTGIPPARLREIFEPFAQLEASGGRNAGLGIGLSLVRDLVQLHGGSVHAHSEGEGLGSEFVVSLPLAGGGRGP